MCSPVVPRQSITALQRKALRKHARENPTFRQVQLSEWFNDKYGKKLSQATVSHSLSRKYESLDESDGSVQQKRRRRTQRHPDLEDSLFEWYEHASAKGVISGEQIREQACLFWSFMKPGAKQPAFSSGWLSGFRNRYGLSKKLTDGGEDSTPQAAAAVQQAKDSPMQDYDAEAAEAAGAKTPMPAPMHGNGNHLLPQYPTDDVGERSTAGPTTAPVTSPAANTLPPIPAAVSVSSSMADELQTLKLVTRQYHPADVYNCDATSLFWKHTPDLSLDSSQRYEARIAVQLCCNGDGSDKLKPLFIGDSADPVLSGAAKTHLLALDCVWRSTAEAWITTSIMKEWLLAFDRHVAVKSRKVLLLLDKFPAYEAAMNSIPPLANTIVCFFPANGSSKMQPLNQGAVGYFKGYYRKRWLQYMIDEYEDGHLPLNTVDLLRALRWSTQAWGDISKATITNCWRDAGFSTLPAAVSDETSPSADVATLVTHLVQRKCIHATIPLERFIEPVEEEIIDKPPRRLSGLITILGVPRGERGGDADGMATIISHKRAHHCVNELLLYLEQQEHGHKSDIDALLELQNQVARKRLDML